jgi:putative endonuclease
MEWFVYLLRCADGSLYCGVCTDLARRVEEHNSSPRGARYTRARRPVALVWQCGFPTRSEACREEARIKRLGRQAKEQLLGASEADAR